MSAQPAIPVGLPHAGPRQLTREGAICLIKLHLPRAEYVDEIVSEELIALVQNGYAEGYNSGMTQAQNNVILGAA